MNGRDLTYLKDGIKDIKTGMDNIRKDNVKQWEKIGTNDKRSSINERVLKIIGASLVVSIPVFATIFFFIFKNL